MKRRTRIATLAVVGLAALSVASCGNNENKYQEFTLDEVKAYAKADLEDVLAQCGAQSQYQSQVWTNLLAKYNAGVAAIDACTESAKVQDAFANAKKEMAAAIPYANGGFNFTALDNTKRTEILGLLEAYAVRNGITGISLFEDGGYVMYHDRVTLGTESYIPGYGFGTLTEGKPTADLASETNADWKRYYHTSDASDPGTANYLNDKGSQVAEYYGYFAGSYFTTFMNSTKDGYDWVPELAKEKPVAVNPNEAGMATKWKFKIRTGETDGLKYSTNSKKADRMNFNDREVAAEDYETAFKFLLTQESGLARGAELAAATTGALKGAAAYYAATETLPVGTPENEAEWSKVGIRTYKEGNDWYLEYEFVAPQTQFYSMYYITSSLYQPVPMEFIQAVGETDNVTNYCGYNSDKSYTPVDNSLALGSFVLEAWETEKEVAYKKNPNYVFASTKYNWPGVKITILKAAESDNTATIKEFLAGNLDSCGIPQDYLDQYKNDKRTRQTTGSSNFKLNVNACDAETWETLFGENGTVTKTEKSKYWQVEPALSNSHFVKALSLSIDRDTFAAARGSIASVDYLSSNYMSDPENGISYSLTDAHKAAVAGLLEGTKNGYNLQQAREYFKLAILELEAAGKYTAGTKEEPTIIELELAWMYPQHETNYHNEIAKYFEDAFNHPTVSDGKYKLVTKFWVGAEWSDVYYNKLMLGQYDIGFGSISGNSLNPLGFISVLSSDQSISGNFTLNWGTDTNDADADILVYNGMRWSYDALWSAANTGAVVQNGNLADVKTFLGAETTAVAENADTVVVTVKTKVNKGEGFEGKIVDFLIMGCNDTSNYSDYVEYSVFDKAEVAAELDADGYQVWTITLTKAEYDQFNALAMAGIDVYVESTIAGVVTTAFATTVDLAVAAE